MLESISSTQLQEWFDYYRLEPFGVDRDNLHTGIIASTIANCNRTSESDKIFTPEDFLLTPQNNNHQTEKQSWQQMLTHAKTITQIFNNS